MSTHNVAAFPGKPAPISLLHFRVQKLREKLWKELDGASETEAEAIMKRHMGEVRRLMSRL